MAVQIIITLFSLYNIYKLILRYKDSDVSLIWFLFWNIVWCAMCILVWVPQTFDWVAGWVGYSQQGIDLIVYAAIIILVYAVFRITLKLEHLEYEITLLVRQRILDEVDKEVSKKVL